MTTTRTRLTDRQRAAMALGDATRRRIDGRAEHAWADALRDAPRPWAQRPRGDAGVSSWVTAAPHSTHEAMLAARQQQHDDAKWRRMELS